MAKRFGEETAQIRPVNEAAELVGPQAAAIVGGCRLLFVFLLWVDFSAQIAFFAADFTHIYARRSGSCRIRAAFAAVGAQEPDSTD